ncbi:glycosyltransferase family A protein [Chelatococcus asaccharovorans]|uniref:glycosyltransferase family A protein n=1 Tax=Chelatococcus asaccharovorans TaxID=28210 RepID=UPI00224C732D|nr:glycosyltransferase family A protein [Chelatococcus asaccharovorans]CAH1668089.1 Glycosyl transferase family 2 [Chelatococcus asaccharovorans]CAH1680398.1 Glycosyl transferase family 2 [Chelatococcus asaccharovorans]
MSIVDVIVPCYRYGRFLERCVASILDQGLDDIRILIIDDASPDDSAAAAAAIARRDRRVSVIVHSVNQGHIATYNEGIDWVEAPYMLLVSADDLVAPGALKRAIAVMEASPAVVLTFGGWAELDTGVDHRPLWSALEAQMLHRVPGWRVEPGARFIRRTCSTAINPIVTATAIVRSAAQKAAGPYRDALTHAGDMEMWLRLAMLGDVAETHAIQGIRGVHGANMSLHADDILLRDCQQRELAFETFFSGPGAALPDASRLRALALRRLAEQAFWTGQAQRWRGNPASGRDLVRFACRLRPSLLVAPPVGHFLHSPRAGRRLAALLGDTGWARALPFRTAAKAGRSPSPP